MYTKTTLKLANRRRGDDKNVTTSTIKPAPFYVCSSGERKQKNKEQRTKK